MRLEYTPTLSEISEASIRMFLRSKTYRIQKISTPLKIVLIVGFFAFLLTQSLSPMVSWAIIFTLMAFFGISSMASYKNAVSRSISKHIKRQFEGLEITPTEYLMEPGKLKIKSMNVVTAFALSELTEVNEDFYYIELFFENRGLCVIPRRVFIDDSEKLKFIQAVKGEPDTGLNSEKRPAPQN